MRLCRGGDSEEAERGRVREIGALACQAEAALGRRLVLSWALDAEGLLHVLGTRQL